MYQQDEDQAPVTFLDVAACFSEEEWRLLHHWQKDLYKNVMKEIHQALTSLGPLIANSVFSLRPKETESVCRPMAHQRSEMRGPLIANSVFSLRPKEKESVCRPMDHQGSEMRGYHRVNPENILRKHQESESRFMDYYGAEGEDSSTGPNIGHVDATPGVSILIKQEGETYSIDHVDSDRRRSLTGSTTGFPFHSIEVEASLRNFHGLEREESHHSLNSGPEVSTLDASIGINEEGETYPIGIQDHRRRESITSPAGEGSMNKQRKVGDSTKWTKRAPPSQAPPGKANINRLPSSHKGRRPRNQTWSESNLGGEKTARCESSFRNTALFNLHQRSPKGENSDTSKEGGRNLRNLKFLKCPPNTQRPNAFTESDESHRLKGERIRHLRMQAGVRPYVCIECKKSFFQKQQLIRHCRTHTGEKPYACTFCNKRFNRKDYLNVHRRIHTGERPYKCTECEKSFTWRNDLKQHRRNHSKCELGN